MPAVDPTPESAAMRAPAGRAHARAAGGTKLRLVDDFEAFQALRTPWNELARAQRPAAVYVSHDWFESWIRAYRAESDLAVQTAWRDGQLVGAAPLRRSTLRFRGMRTRSLAWLWSAVAPRCHFLLAEEDDLAPLLDGVLATPAWDVLVAENVPEESATARGLRTELVARGIRHQAAATFRSPYRSVEGGFATYWDGLDRERRRYLQKKCVNRLARADEAVEIATLPTRAAFEAFVPDMYALSARSWKAAEGAALRADAPEARLLVDFARIGLERGWVRVDTLRIAGRLVAFEYMLVSEGRYAVARSDYDVEDRYYTPGNSLRLRIVQSLFEDPGAVEYDLAGDDAPYKREWCDRIRPHTTFTLGSRSLRGRAVLATKTVLLPALRRLGGRNAAGDAG